MSDLNPLSENELEILEQDIMEQVAWVPPYVKKIETAFEMARASLAPKGWPSIGDVQNYAAFLARQYELPQRREEFEFFAEEVVQWCLDRCHHAAPQGEADKLLSLYRAECEAGYQVVYGQFNSEESLDSKMAEHLAARAARIAAEGKMG